MRLSPGYVLFPVICLVCAALSGCELSSTAVPTAEAGVAFSGKVMGGQQAIADAHVYLFAANTTGYGGAAIAASSNNASVSLLTSSVLTNNPLNSGQDGSGNYYVTTDSAGTFSITSDYSCASGQQVYLYSVGGNAGAGTNSAAGLLEVLGNCPGGTSAFASADPNIIINEVTTIAAAYAFAGFATDATHVSSSGSALALTGIANAFANAGNLANIVTGSGLATTAAGNGTVPQTEIYTLANILAACVNSTGPGSSACSTLLADALSGGTTGTAPTDTATGAINMAHNPGANIAALFALSTATPQFAPALSAQPGNLTVAINYTGGGLSTPMVAAIDSSGNVWTANNGGNSISEFASNGSAISPATTGFTGGGLNFPWGIAIDASGHVWVTDFGEALSNSQNNAPGNSVSEFTSLGSAMSPAITGYTGGGLAAPSGLAIDTSNNVWVADDNNRCISKLNSSGSPGSGAGGYTGGGLMGATGIAIDVPGNVWVTDNDSSGLSKFNSSGGAISGTNEYTGGGQDSPAGIAIDASGNIWDASASANTISEISSSGTPVSSTGYTGGGLNRPYGIAIDGSGNVWVANNSSNTVIELNSSGTPISGTSGYGNGGVNSPFYVAIDGSGNVWVTNLGTSSMTQFIGAATPVVTPIVANLKSPYGSKAVNKP